MAKNSLKQTVEIPVDSITLEGILEIPPNARGIVIFAHGSGSGRFSPRNIFVADDLRNKGVGTLLLDLLTPEEDLDYQSRFNIDLLTQRLAAAISWIKQSKPASKLGIGLFGASTGAAAALKLAAILGPEIKAVVSRGGRPDMAEPDLHRVKSPTLLIVGGSDVDVIEINRIAYEKLESEKKLEIIPGATHLFEEPGTLERVAELAANWFTKSL